MRHRITNKVMRGDTHHGIILLVHPESCPINITTIENTEREISFTNLPVLDELAQ